jgi:geranylgeranylglycerol-phosphate geranylgeranyltransferase
MRIISLFLLSSMSNGFIPPPRSPVRVQNITMHSSSNTPILKKISEFSKLTRFQSNFIPVSLVTFLGAYVTNPTAWKSWIQYPPFWAAYLIIQSVTAVSMVVNDIQDIKVDRINNPQRPLVRGTITKREAELLVCSLYSIVSYLGIRYLPPVLDPFWTGSLFLITIYTPILKRICFIKNLTCAIIIASTIPFMGFSTLNPTIITVPDLHWMCFTTGILFESSMYIELLLDISDKEGDEIMNIPTVPVIFGKRAAAILIFSILQFGYYLTVLSALEWNNPSVLLTMLVTHVPLNFNLARVWHNDFNRKTIKESVKFTTVSLFLYLIIVLFSIKT